MIKIAIACEKDIVTQHFGHCQNFNIYDIENNEIVNESSVDNPGHRPGFLPNFLNDIGINVIISGGMGGGAIDIFNEKGIKTVIGASGNAKDTVVKYIKGELVSTDSACKEHSNNC